MNKIKYIIPILIILLIPLNVSAKTLGQLKQEYETLEAQLKSKNDEIKKNEQDQANTNNKIQDTYNQIAQAERDIKDKNEEINKLNEEIKQKNEEIKNLIRFKQVSEGESIYLEYIFKADSITDFIYRVSVVERLSEYNDSLINEMNEMIEKNKKNIEELHKKEEALSKLQEELKGKLELLKAEQANLSSEEDSLEKDIEASKKIIDFYIDSGCKESQDIATCANKQLPPGTRFWRPLNSGYMTSTWYSDILSGGSCRSHAGVDIAASTGTPVYAVAPGKVSYTGYSSDGYGNKVIVQHNINGQNYTTLYGHLDSITSYVGQIVDKDTMIGRVGNTGHSYGSHLHLNLCIGLNSCVSRWQTTDPGAYINFPENHTWYYDRTSYYSGYYSNPCGW